ncbi:hypothetical protein FH972_025002 [Carpinus fangiana]|uniref:Uncharacterized protein n=1 Tax=Carpinus fangiana TaxID=176857 RepID=A0A5N6L044_9ROSI|nr:hypothetical protein FH972_025002 [Carpinus fangiana]
MLAKTILLVPRLGRRRRSHAERLVKETHWFSKFCRTTPDDVAKEGAYFGQLLLRGRGQAKGNQSCNGWTSVGEDNQVISLP